VKNGYRCTCYAQILKIVVPVHSRGDLLTIPVPSPISRAVVNRSLGVGGLGFRV
jgi:hypothetical protein